MVKRFKALTSRMFNMYGWMVDKVTLEISSDYGIDTQFCIWNEHDAVDKEDGDKVTEFQKLNYSPQQISEIVKGVTEIITDLGLLDDDEVEFATKLIEKIHNIR